MTLTSKHSPSFEGITISGNIWHVLEAILFERKHRMLVALLEGFVSIVVFQTRSSVVHGFNLPATLLKAAVVQRRHSDTLFGPGEWEFEKLQQLIQTGFQRLDTRREWHQ